MRSANRPPPPRRVWVGCGDSITAGYGLPVGEGFMWIAARARVGDGLQVAAGPGYTVAQIATLLPALAFTDQFSGVPLDVTRVVALLGGTNDLVLNGQTDGVALSDEILSMEAQARAAWSWARSLVVVVGTIPKSFFCTGPQELARQVCNARLRTRVRTAGYGEAPPLQNPSSTDLSIFYDGTHPTALGHLCFASELIGAAGASAGG